MKVLAFTNGSIEVASSRLRSYYLLGALPERNFLVSRTFGWKVFFATDLVHFQKTLRPNKLILHAICKLCAKKTVYDIDDQPHNVFVAALMIFNALMSNVLTVDTLERKRYWERIFFWKRVVVIPDVLDVPDLKTGRSNCLRNVKSKKLNIVWIGHPLNIPSIAQLLENESVGKSFNLTVITARDSISRLSDRYPNAKFVPWEKDILFHEDQRFDCMVLNHFGEEVSLMKSDNKMALAVAACILPIVSNTPSYKRLAKDLGYEKFVFNKIEEAIEIIASISDRDFDRLLYARSIVQNKYSAAIVAKDFVKLINS